MHLLYSNRLICPKGEHLRCSNADVVKSIFLPLGDKNNNYMLSIVVTVKNEYEETTTTIDTQVCHNVFQRDIVDIKEVLYRIKLSPIRYIKATPIPL